MGWIYIHSVLNKIKRIPISLLKIFQKKFLNLDNSSGREISDEENIGKLNSFIEDEIFTTIRKYMETL